jgi:hypothetical protein
MANLRTEQVERLRTHEREQEQKVKDKQQAIEALEYQRRQQLLAEIETVRLRSEISTCVLSSAKLQLEILI